MSSGKKIEYTIHELYIGKLPYTNDFIKAVVEQTESISEEKRDEDGVSGCGCPICDDFLDGNFDYGDDEGKSGIEHLQQVANLYHLPIKIVFSHKKKETFVFR